MRVGFIGCVESSAVALAALLRLRDDGAHLVGVMTRKASRVNADFRDLVPLAEAHGLPVLFHEDAPDDAAQAAWFGSLDVDIIFCVGWSRLLGPAMLGIAPRGVVGYHPAALPANRGRHPLIWALALGLDHTASSFFLMHADADAGPLLHQLPMAISEDDDAAALYAKVLLAIDTQLPLIVRGLVAGTLQAMPQDVTLASHWRKRGAADGLIDWRMGATNVRNLVRALGPPYPGAEFLRDGQAIKLWACAVVPGAAPHHEPGKVLAVDGRAVTVKCGVDALLLLDHGLLQLPAPGDYL